MPKIRIWSVGSGEGALLARPEVVPPLTTYVEKDLEDWIQRNPSLLMEDVRWVGRQLVLPDRTRLDLLGLAPDDTWVVAELKASVVDVATLTQALGYALWIGTMSAEELLRRLGPNCGVDESELKSVCELPEGEPRRLQIVLAGTSVDPSLEGAAKFLSQSGLTTEVTIVTFELFQEQSGKVLIARNVAELPTSSSAATARGASLDSVMAKGEEHGTRDVLESFRDFAASQGLPIRSWGSSFTINWPKNKRNTMVYIAPKQDRQLSVWCASATLSAELGMDDGALRAELGQELFGTQTVKMTRDQSMAFLEKLRALFARQRAEAGLKGSEA
jgi:hypothetical protein